MKENDYEGWRIDRRIPVPTLMVLFVYSLGIVWWGGNNGRTHRQAGSRLPETGFPVLKPSAHKTVGVTILETKIDNLSQDIRDLKNLIEKRYSNP